MEKTNTRLSVFNLKAEVVDQIQLDEKIFDGKVNETLLYEAKKMYEANKRQGNASTKTRAEVEGGGAKPWKQKGTGRARVGSSRNPIWRHGGIVFGPKPRDFRYSMPKKSVKKALISIINAKILEEKIKPIVKIELKENKTKEINNIINNFDIKKNVLIIVNESSKIINRCVRNIKNASIKEVRDFNMIDVLKKDTILIEKDAIKKLIERLA